MQSDSAKHHRHSIRLQGYDYSQSGAYFVTVVTLWRECLFGKIVNSKMELHKLGRIVRECWEEIPGHFPHVEMNKFVVMPNHIHGIILIHENDRSDTSTRSRGTIYRAPTLALHPSSSNVEEFGKPVVGSLPTIIRTYKAAVTRRAGRELTSATIWQRNFYEHIIRDQADYERIAKYIAANPSYWAEDNEHPSAK